MNCDSARDLLSAFPPDVGVSDQPAQASALQHLEQCADCQAFLEARRSFESDAADRELSRAMQNVAVPVDLKSRLLAQLAATTPVTSATSTTIGESAPETAIVTPATPTANRPTAKRSWNRRGLLAAAALVLLSLGGGWWFFHVNQKVVLTVKQLVDLSHQAAQAGAGAFQQTFQPALPVNEIRMPGVPSGMFSLQYQGREIGAMLPFQAFARPPLKAVLVVIDLQRVVVRDLDSVGGSFVTGETLYPNQVATRVWRVGENMYVCYVNSKDRTLIDRLKAHSLAT